METVVFCPKCQSEKVTTVQVRKAQKHMVSMDELGQELNPPPVKPQTLYKTTCDKCGYSVQYHA